MTLCVDFWMLPAWRTAGFKIEEPFSDYIWLGGSYIGKTNVQFQVWQYMTPYRFRRRILSKKKQASAACIVNLYCTRKLQIANSRSPGSPRSYLNLQSSIMDHSPRALFLWFSIKLSFYPATNQAPIKVKCRRKTSTILLATQTHSSMQDKASEVVALGGFNFVSHLSRLISKLKVISDKCFSTQFENSRLSLLLYALCMNSACVSGSLTVGCFALELFRTISHRFLSIIPQQVWRMRQQHTVGTVISLLSHLTRRLRAIVFSFTVLLSDFAHSKPLAANGGFERSFGACTSQWNSATIADPHCQKSTTRQKWGLPEEYIWSVLFCM